MLELVLKVLFASPPMSNPMQVAIHLITAYVFNVEQNQYNYYNKPTLFPSFFLCTPPTYNFLPSCSLYIYSGSFFLSYSFIRSFLHSFSFVLSFCQLPFYFMSSLYSLLLLSLSITPSSSLYALFFPSLSIPLSLSPLHYHFSFDTCLVFHNTFFSQTFLDNFLFISLPQGKSKL